MVLAAVAMLSTGPLETNHAAVGVAGLSRPSLYLQHAFDADTEESKLFCRTNEIELS